MTESMWLPVTGKWRVLGPTVCRRVGWELGWKLGSRHRRRNGWAGEHTETRTATADQPQLAIRGVVARVALVIAGGQRRR
jgi:hypothetical protein